MQNRRVVLTALVALLVVVAGLLFWKNGDDAPSLAPLAGQSGAAGDTGSVSADLAAVQAEDGVVGASSRRSGGEGRGQTGIRGVVLDARTGQPLGGIEVLALAQQPSLEPLVSRFRGLFQGGVMTETRRPAQVLGMTLSAPDGSFELLGLSDGMVFLDGRSDAYFVRTPGTARLAVGEIVEGVELRAEPGGRVRGIVLGVDGAPVAGASVSLRPGLNAFLGQLTDRRYRWLETVTGDDGRFDLPGVPPGNGYVVSANADVIALEEAFGIDVREGQVSEVVIQGHPGATVSGTVVDLLGEPIAGANVAMVYLDISRVLFSADGRSEPIVTDDNGQFMIRPVAAGRVAFVAVADGQAPSQIEELAVVDGGIYPDLELQVGEGAVVTGMVIDDREMPVAGATVELRPFERPDDPQFLKMMLKIRRVEVETDGEGRFVAAGMTGDRLIVQASKSGYTTAVRSGVRLDEENLRIKVYRGAVVRGRVQLASGEPLTRFRIDTRTRSERNSDSGDEESESSGENDRDGTSRASGSRRWRSRGSRTRQLPEGQDMTDRGMNMSGNWREIASKDGTFELTGIPPGRIRVRARADDFLDPDSQEIELASAQVSDELVFTFAGGISVVGTVVDAVSRRPISDAQVTAYRDRGRRSRGGFFQVNIDPEDMDFLALSASSGRRSAITDSRGQFEIGSLEAGKYRFTARHPDMAKSSAKDVEVTEEGEIPPVEIELGTGGVIEGQATGYGMRPLGDAVIAAFSMQSGTLRSAATDKQGFYRIDGLPPGQYAVFKSRMDQRADNIPLELLSNMRLKTTSVREGKVSRLDIHDEGEDGVRIYGVVRENGEPVPRALITLLGTDTEGFMGMGVRANAAGMDGRYELIGIQPGDYVAQVSRFQGRPVQTTFPIEVPEDVRDFSFDIDLPTSEVSGQVIDSRGNPVVGMRVSLGSADDGFSLSDGLVGIIAQGGLSRARTDDNGYFRMRSVSAGSYRLMAENRGRGRGRRSGGESTPQYGSGSIEQIEVDGVTNLEGLIVTVPIAGRIEGIVIDGSGQPVGGAEITYAKQQERRQRGNSNPLASLFGIQARPITTGRDGRFEIRGLNPGVYDLRVDTEALEAGSQSDIQVTEDAVANVTLNIVRGATLKVRAKNVEQSNIPLAYVTLLNGEGKAVVRKISTMSVMRRLLSNRQSVSNSGWYEFGSVPPDTYTLVIAEPDKPELRITRTIADGETVEWDIDVAAELAARDK